MRSDMGGGEISGAYVSLADVCCGVVALGCRFASVVARDLRECREGNFTCGGVALAAPLPKTTGNFERVDVPLLPPRLLLSRGVDVVVMGSAKWNGELIADLQAEPSRLRIAHMVRVRGRASADETRLARDEAQMVL